MSVPKNRAGNTVQNLFIRGGAVLLLGVYFLISTVASCLDKFSKSPRDIAVVAERSKLRKSVLAQIKNHVKHLTRPADQTKPRHRA